MINGHIEAEGIDETQRLIDRIDEGLSDIKDFMQPVGEFLKGYYSRVPFETSGSVFGDTWQSLVPSYQRAKQKKYPGRGILDKSGDLRKRFDYRIESDYLEVFNPVDYFVYHQSSAPRRKLPRRVMLAINQQVRDGVVEKLTESLVDKIRKIL